MNHGSFIIILIVQLFLGFGTCFGTSDLLGISFYVLGFLAALIGMIYHITQQCDIEQREQKEKANITSYGTKNVFRITCNRDLSLVAFNYPNLPGRADFDRMKSMNEWGYEWSIESREAQLIYPGLNKGIGHLVIAGGMGSNVEFRFSNSVGDLLAVFVMSQNVMEAIFWDYYSAKKIQITEGSTLRYPKTRVHRSGSVNTMSVMFDKDTEREVCSFPHNIKHVTLPYSSSRGFNYTTDNGLTGTIILNTDSSSFVMYIAREISEYIKSQKAEGKEV